MCECRVQSDALRKHPGVDTTMLPRYIKDGIESSRPFVVSTYKSLSSSLDGDERNRSHSRSLGLRLRSCVRTQARSRCYQG